MHRLSSAVRLILLSSTVAAVSVLATGRETGRRPVASPDDAGLRAQLIERDTRMHDALPRGSGEPYESWTDDYTEINEAGELLSKAEVRARYHAAANRRPNIPPEDYAIRIHRDVVIMTHVLKRRGLEKDKDGYPVIPTIYSYRVTHVFTKRDGGWQMLSTQWTPVARTRAESSHSVKASNAPPDSSCQRTGR